MNKKISIIIPVYKAEDYLKKCLDSVINQTYKFLEIICVIDGSPDNSIAICQKYAENDDRFVIINQENKCASFSRNTGLSVATGDYIMFVDADDWIDLNTCELAISAIIENNSDVVMWAYISERKNSSEIKSVFSVEYHIFESNEVINLHRRFIGIINEELSSPEKADSLCTIWGKLYKSELIKDNNIAFQDIREIGTYEDGLFNLEVFNFVKKAVYINKPLYHYRRDNTSSVTSGYRPKLKEQWGELFRRMQQYIVDNNLSDEYSLALANRISLSVIGLGGNIISEDENIAKKKSSI